MNVWEGERERNRLSDTVCVCVCVFLNSICVCLWMPLNQWWFIYALMHEGPSCSLRSHIKLKYVVITLYNTQQNHHFTAMVRASFLPFLQQSLSTLFHKQLYADKKQQEVLDFLHSSHCLLLRSLCRLDLGDTLWCVSLMSWHFCRWCSLWLYMYEEWPPGIRSHFSLYPNMHVFLFPFCEVQMCYCFSSCSGSIRP